MYVSTTIYGIYKSTDNGINWSPIFHHFGVPSLNTLNISLKNNYLFAGAKYGAGIYRSEDLGKNWSRIDTNLPYLSTCYSIEILKSGELFAAVNGGIYFSNDNGVTWVKRLDESYNILKIKVIPKNKIMATSSITRKGILISTDLGENWSNHGTGLNGLGIYSLNYKEISQDSVIYYAGTENGLYYLYKGNWNQIGVQKTEINFMTSDLHGTPLIGTKNGILFSNDKANSWEYFVNKSFFTLLSPVTFFIIKDDTTFFVSEKEIPPFITSISRSTDKGSNWVSIQTGISSDVSCAAVSKNGYLFVGSVNSGLYRSSDDGNNWETKNNGIPNDTIRFIFADDSDNIYINNFNLYISTNYGGNWKKIFSNSSKVNCIDFNSFNTIFIGTKDGKILKSSNYGVDWELVFDKPQVQEIIKIKIPEFGFFKNNIFATTVAGGIFMSSNNGLSWVAINDGIDDLQNFSSIISDSTGIIYVINKYEIYRSKKNYTHINYEEKVAISSFELYQNYPNPFNPTTIINYSVPKQSNVKLIIYDALGREVANLVNEEKSTGNYMAEFDAANLSSGIYFYQIRAGEFVQTKKMILLR